MITLELKLFQTKNVALKNSKAKNIILTVHWWNLTMILMALGEFRPPIATNVSFVFIDDTKSIDNLNITLTTLKA